MSLDLELILCSRHREVNNEIDLLGSKNEEIPKSEPHVRSLMSLLLRARAGIHWARVSVMTTMSLAVPGSY